MLMLAKRPVKPSTVLERGTIASSVTSVAEEQYSSALVGCFKASLYGSPPGYCGQRCQSRIGNKYEEAVAAASAADLRDTHSCRGIRGGEGELNVF